jgi:hypothetical protein
MNDLIAADSAYGQLLALCERRTRVPAPWDHAFQGFRIDGERDWLVLGEPARCLDDIATAVGASVAERLAPGVLKLRFGNAVGRVVLPHLGVVDIVSGKWHEAHFEQMLTELMNIASALPFTADAATALPHDRSVDAAPNRVLYHAFIYLRHILCAAAPPAEQLLPALDAILRDPHRRPDCLESVVPLERAHRVDGFTVSRLLCDPARLVPVARTGSRGSRLAEALGGHLPTHIDERQSITTVDTAENRFVKTFLATAQGVLTAMRRVVEEQSDSKEEFGKRIQTDCFAMEQALQPAVRHRLWHEVGDLHHVPASSTAMQRRYGYREVFRHDARLRLAARVPLADKTVRDLLEVKDIALLYELWCFFIVIRLLQEKNGSPIAAGVPSASETHLSVSHGLEIRWSNGTTLHYNVGFSRSATAGRRSYSVPLRPDIVLNVPMGPNRGLHMFDAKFRVDHVDGMMDSAEDDLQGARTETEHRGRVKRSDLYKMHTYRDALEAASVWVLYPGSDFRFFASSHQHRIAKDPRELNKQGIDGIGAVPLAPANSADQLRHLLNRIQNVE